MLYDEKEKTAIIWGDREISFREVAAHAAEYALGLDVAPGARVAIFSENRPEWIYALYAAWRRSAIVVPVDALSPPEEVAYILGDSRPDVVFCSRDREPVLRQAGAPAWRGRIAVFEDLPGCAAGPSGAPFPPPDDPVRVALIMYTSGTTGNPKGVQLTFDNLLVNIESVSRHVPIYTPDETVLALLPLHHILPLVGCVVAPLWVGSTICFASPLAPAELVATMRRRRVTIVIGVPRFYSMIRKGIMERINARPAARLLFRAARRLNSRAVARRLFGAVHRQFGGRLKYLICGGAALDPEVGRDLWTLGFEVLEGYGMTEAAPMITFPRPGRVRLGACGQALPGQQVRIVDGEITAAGRNIMPGYYNRPEETAAALRDGWLYTGDLGYLDADGYLFVTGRKKELVVLPTGKKFNPSEVESRLLAISPLVKEAAVFLKDDVLQALVFPDPARAAARPPPELFAQIRAEVMDVYNRSAAPAKRIQRFTIVGQELPKTRLGKLKRHQLPALAAPPPRVDGGAEPATPEYAALRDFLRAEVARPVGPDEHLATEVGLDSLGWVGLQVFAQETFGVALDESTLTAHPTVARLAAHLAERKTRLQTAEALNWNALLDKTAGVELPRASVLLPIIHWLARLGLKTFFRVRAFGLEHLPAPPFILAPNHQSYLDGLWVTIFLRARQLRQTYFYAKAKHVRRRWQQFLAARTNVIVVDIEHDLAASLRKMAAVLKRGRNLIIFPEGTRTRDGRIGEFKKTFAILSSALDVPVVPVALSGAYAALPPGRRLPRLFTAVTVQFLPPRYPRGQTAEAVGEQVRQAVVEALR